MFCTCPTTSGRLHRSHADGGRRGDQDVADGHVRAERVLLQTGVVGTRCAGAARPVRRPVELGLGAGYAQNEFEAAELRYPSARERIDYLAHVTEYMGEHLPDVPVLIAGNGDRLLTVAARQANIIGLTGGQLITEDDDALAERVDFVRSAAGDRFDELELNLAITALPRDESGQPDLSIIRRALPHLSDDQLVQTAAVLSGSPRQMADTIRGYRDTYGVSYLIVQDKHAEAFSKVIAELR